MSTIEKTYHDEIEVERLWTATKQGQFVFFSILPISILLVFLLWDDTSQLLLLIWFTVLTVINFLRWMSMQFYRTHKETLIANVSCFKWILVTGSACAGLWWGIGVLWFLEPSQPHNVLLMCIYVFIISMGAILAWSSYLPAVLAILLPPMAPLIGLLFIQGDTNIVIISLIILALGIIGVIGSKYSTINILTILGRIFCHIQLTHGCV